MPIEERIERLHDKMWRCRECESEVPFEDVVYEPLNPSGEQFVHSVHMGLGNEPPRDCGPLEAREKRPGTVPWIYRAATAGTPNEVG